MKPLFSEEGLRRLEELSSLRTVYAFDFDGTLAKIEREPSKARLAKETEALILRLIELSDVAVVSGRSVQDLKGKFSRAPKYLIGNHGLEGLSSKEGSLDRARQACALWTERLTPLVRSLRGVELEDKGVSLALHYRNAAEKEPSREKLMSFLSGMSPEAKLVTGKSVINVLPSDAPHKGSAMLDLLRATRAERGFYIGDDDTDEDVFSLPDDRITSVRVGRKSASSARFFIDRQSEVNALLKRLIGLLEGRF